MSKIERSLEAKAKVGCGAVHLNRNEIFALYQITVEGVQRGSNIPVRPARHSSSSSTSAARRGKASATAAVSALPQTTPRGT